MGEVLKSTWRTDWRVRNERENGGRKEVSILGGNPSGRDRKGIAVKRKFWGR